MKAIELRLNNWVWNDVQKIPVKVDVQIIQDQVYADKGLKESWQPIPLTEDICKNKISFDKDELIVECLWGFKDGGDNFFTIKTLNPANIAIVKLSHVHEIQNLVQDLGKELEVNL